MTDSNAVMRHLHKPWARNNLTWECFTEEMMVDVVLKDRWSSPAEKRGKSPKGSERVKRKDKVKWWT